MLWPHENKGLPAQGEGCTHCHAASLTCAWNSHSERGIHRPVCVGGGPISWKEATKDGHLHPWRRPDRGRLLITPKLFKSQECVLSSRSTDKSTTSHSRRHPTESCSGVRHTKLPPVLLHILQATQQHKTQTPPLIRASGKDQICASRFRIHTLSACQLQ